jgi:hypothetical protein
MKRKMTFYETVHWFFDGVLGVVCFFFDKSLKRMQDEEIK